MIMNSFTKILAYFSVFSSVKMSINAYKGTVIYEMNGRHGFGVPCG